MLFSKQHQWFSHKSLKFQKNACHSFRNVLHTTWNPDGMSMKPSTVLMFSHKNENYFVDTLNQVGFLNDYIFTIVEMGVGF